MFHTTLVARLVLFATRVADSMRCDCWSKMSIFTTQCPLCRKVFKTFYSLKKHVRERHDGVDEESLIPAFQDQEGNVVQIPAAKESLNANAKTSYITWIGGIVERMNATFHPRLPGNFPQLHRQLFSICSSSMLLIGLLVCKNPDITNPFGNVTALSVHDQNPDKTKPRSVTNTFSRNLGTSLYRGFTV